MGKKKEERKKKGGKEKDGEKEGKGKGGMEGIKKGGGGERGKGKEIDVMKICDKWEVEKLGYGMKRKKGGEGVLVSWVLVVDGGGVKRWVGFVGGELGIKWKKGDGMMSSGKWKKEKESEEEVDEEESCEEKEE